MNMNDIIEDVLESSNKIVIVSLIAKAIILVLLFFAVSDQPSEFYVFIRWVFFILFLLITFLDQQRNKKISVYFWIAFATFFNPLIPIYFQNKEIWGLIDSLIFITILVTGFLQDIVDYNFELEIASHIERIARKSSPNILYSITYKAKLYYVEGLKDINSNRNYLKISECLFDILIKYLPDNPDFYIMRGIVKSKLYSIKLAFDDFEYARRKDNRVLIPSANEIRDLTLDNYKEQLFV
jgi:hypothetical protein